MASPTEVQDSWEKNGALPGFAAGTCRERHAAKFAAVLERRMKIWP